jgi:hypothetical protein
MQKTPYTKGPLSLFLTRFIRDQNTVTVPWLPGGGRDLFQPWAAAFAGDGTAVLDWRSLALAYLSALTISSHIFLASPNSIIVLSR